MTANWKVNQYTVTYKDVFVDSSNVAHGDPLGTTTKQKDYGSTVNATELGTDGSLNKYYSYYRYKGSSGKNRCRTEGFPETIIISLIRSMILMW